MSNGTDSKLYVLLVILSIAIVVIAAGMYSFVVAAGVKSFNIATPEQKFISVSGSASIFVVPDTASISVGVLTSAKTAGEASAKNAAAMTAVIGALKNLGLTDAEIRTSFLSIQPEYNFSAGTPSIQTISGYSASNNVQVTTKSLEKLSNIVDKSVAAGANQVGGISFTVSEEKQKQVSNELLANAIKDAQTKANNLAQSLNVRIAGVRTASISEPGFPQPFSIVAQGLGTATPIQPGETRVTLSVQITYTIE